jgi:hypothetical protein
MQIDEIDHVDSLSEPASYPNPRNFARMIVINNSQIIAAFMRTTQILGLIASASGLLIHRAPVGIFRSTLKGISIAALAVGFGFFLSTNILEWALRRCPVCRSRITKVTEEKRHCLECGIELWDFWDE